MTMFQKSMFGSSKAVGMFANRKAKQSDLFGGLMPLRNDPPAREPLVGQTSFLDLAAAPLATQQEDVATPAPNGQKMDIPAGWTEIEADDAPPAPPVPAHAAPADCSPTIDNVAAIIDLFSTAKANGLQWPKIRLQVPPNGAMIVLSLVGSGKNAGKIRVTDGGAYGDPDSTFYGFIDLDGRFSGDRRWQGILEILIKLAADPAGVAAEYGKGTGECCFCGRPLTNGKAGSVDVGYGPVCAERFSLPWNPNGKDYEMVVGAALAAVAVEIETVEEVPAFGQPIQMEQPALPAPKPMLALPSPEPTNPYMDADPALLDELDSLEIVLKEEIDKQADMVMSNEARRQFNTPRRYSVQDLKAGRSRIAKLRAKIAKLEASK